jgi:hypothetical protein
MPAVSLCGCQSGGQSASADPLCSDSCIACLLYSRCVRQLTLMIYYQSCVLVPWHLEGVEWYFDLRKPLAIISDYYLYHYSYSHLLMRCETLWLTV